ncbi:8794_t:CDS:2 [Scutellospora calospora]|uniref:8794_t:CDS:1 n=1 Tax=Scutellospora calospora TaxID=85575 RepID=A0ACA9KUU6_9GLOM|nr:8794_t:CDS:2 [Scutellospora calospora]
MSHNFTINVTSPMRYQTPNFSVFTPLINLPFPPTIKAAEIVDRRKSSQLTMKSPNAFFIYRKAFLDHLSETYKDLKMTDVSKLVGICWRNEPEVVKEEYRKLSKQVEIELNNKRQKNVSFRRVVWKNSKLSDLSYSSNQFVFYEFIPNPSQNSFDSTSDTPSVSAPITTPSTENTTPFFLSPVPNVNYSFKDQFNVVSQDNMDIELLPDIIQHDNNDNLGSDMFDPYSNPLFVYDVIQQQNDIVDPGNKFGLEFP